MRPSTRTWWASPWTGALLALLACGLVAPSEAKAGCRHPGLARWGSSVMLDHLDGLTIVHSAPAPRQAPVELPAPCKGPSCSGQNAPPLTPPTPTPPDPGQRWALGVLAPPSADSASETTPRDGERMCPLRIPLSVFRPPPAFTSLPTS